MQGNPNAVFISGTGRSLGRGIYPISLNHLFSTSSTFSSENRTIQGIISELEAVIDQIDTYFDNARGLISELAKRLSETNQCELSQICRKIKRILKDQIKNGKITEKWIEECLPQDYKRKYTKSEVSSLSRKAKKLQEVVIDNNGSISVQSLSPKRLDIENTSYKESVGEGSLPTSREEHLENSETRVDNGECVRCTQLEEALIKASPISTAEYLSDNEIEFIIPRNRYKEIKSAMRRSNDSFLLIVEATSRSLVSVEPDTLG